MEAALITRRDDETTALVPVNDPGSPLPVFSGEQMAEAFRAYRQLQETLDRAMPDAIMQIQGRAFRKKAYWRAVRTAFNLDVTMVEEHREVLPDGNWGWLVTYRAKAQNGRAADGDGACYASEKTGRGQATEHNVRSHAHTRAFNRAVSNLVGFGEVSAEEADRDAPPRREMKSAGSGSTASVGGEFISEPQRKRLFAIAREHGWQNEDVAQWLREVYQVDSTAKVPRAKYDEICKGLEMPSHEPEEPRDAF